MQIQDMTFRLTVFYGLITPAYLLFVAIIIMPLILYETGHQFILGKSDEIVLPFFDRLLSKFATTVRVWARLEEPLAWKILKTK